MYALNAEIRSSISRGDVESCERIIRDHYDAICADANVASFVFREVLKCGDRRLLETVVDYGVMDHVLSARPKSSFIVDRLDREALCFLFRSGMVRKRMLRLPKDHPIFPHLRNGYCFKREVMNLSSDSLPRLIDMQGVDDQGDSMLHYAMSFGRHEAVSLLLKGEQRNVSTLISACTFSMLDVVSKCLDDMPTWYMRTREPLVLAVHRNIALTRLILEKGGGRIINHDYARDGYIPTRHHHLMTAIMWKDMEMVRLLISHGADVNAPDSNGILPLCRAVPSPDMVELLLEHGADPNGRRGSGTSSTITNLPLHVACQLNSLRACEILMASGAEADATCPRGWFPLHYAAQTGDLGVCRLLLEGGGGKGLRVTLKGGWTASGLAINNGHVELCKWLMEQGDSFEITDDLIVSTCQNGDYRAAELMMSLGASFPVSFMRQNWDVLGIDVETLVREVTAQSPDVPNSVSNLADLIVWVYKAFPDIPRKYVVTIILRSFVDADYLTLVRAGTLIPIMCMFCSLDDPVGLCLRSRTGRLRENRLSMGSFFRKVWDKKTCSSTPFRVRRMILGMLMGIPEAWYEDPFWELAAV